VVWQLSITNDRYTTHTNDRYVLGLSPNPNIAFIAEMQRCGVQNRSRCGEGRALLEKRPRNAVRNVAQK